MNPDANCTECGQAREVRNQRRMKMESMSETLRQARDLIAKGWTTGALERDGKYCARGAINKVLFGDPRSEREWDESSDVALAHELLLAAIPANEDKRPGALTYQRIYWWNDSQHGRKAHAKVVAAFDRAIAIAEKLEEDARDALAEEFTIAPMMIELSDPSTINERVLV